MSIKIYIHCWIFSPDLQWHLIVTGVCECWGWWWWMCGWGLCCDGTGGWRLFELGSSGGERLWGEADMGQEEIIITHLCINKISSQACFCPSVLHSAELGSYFLTIKSYSAVLSLQLTIPLLLNHDLTFNVGGTASFFLLVCIRALSL